jgi:hypothetical protein
MRPRRLDSGPHCRTLVARKIVHHHDVTGLESGHEHLVDIGLEGDAVDRPVEHHRRDHAGESESCHEGRRLPVAMRDAGPEPLTPWGAATKAGHVGGGPCLVDKHEAGGIEIEQGVEPVLAPLQDVRTVLFGRVRGLFLNVRPQRSRKVHSVARLAWTPRSAASFSSISLMVMSGVVSTSRRM